MRERGDCNNHACWPPAEHRAPLAHLRPTRNFPGPSNSLRLLRHLAARAPSPSAAGRLAGTWHPATGQGADPLASVLPSRSQLDQLTTLPAPSCSSCPGILAQHAPDLELSMPSSRAPVPLVSCLFLPASLLRARDPAPPLAPTPPPSRRPLPPAARAWLFLRPSSWVRLVLLLLRCCCLGLRSRPSARLLGLRCCPDTSDSGLCSAFLASAGLAPPDKAIGVRAFSAARPEVSSAAALRGAAWTLFVGTPCCGLAFPKKWK